MQHIIGAIYNRLINDATLQSYVGQRVYVGEPYPSPTLPYVTIVVNDLRDVLANGAVRAVSVGLVSVYAVVAGNAAIGEQIADRIDQLLHSWSSPPSIWAITRERMIYDIETNNNRTVSLRGATYDVVASPV